MCTQSEWFWIDAPSNKIGEKTLPQLPNKKPYEMFTHPLEPYYDVDVPVFALNS